MAETGADTYSMHHCNFKLTRYPSSH